MRVVAEIGQAKGDPQYVRAAAKASAAAGCWGVKLQLLQPEGIAQANAPVYWDETRPDITDQRANFARTGCLPYDPAVLGPLVEEARAEGVELFASPFDRVALGVMQASGMRWCKLASGDITNEELVRAAARAFPGHLIMATGASAAWEIVQAVRWAQDEGADPAYLLACSLVYPSVNRVAEIARVRALRATFFGSEVGYSDHTFGVNAAPVAVGAGATMLEKHVTLDRDDPDVPDNAFALEPWELARYVEMANAAAEMVGTGVLDPTPAEMAARAGARRSLCAAVDLPAGTVLAESMVTALRPHQPAGFDASERGLVVGCQLTEAVPSGAPILRSMVES